MNNFGKRPSIHKKQVNLEMISCLFPERRRFRANFSFFSWYDAKRDRFSLEQRTGKKHGAEDHELFYSIVIERIKEKEEEEEDLLCSSLRPCNLSLFASCCAFLRSRQALKNHVQIRDSVVFSFFEKTYRLAILFFSFLTSTVSLLFVV